jgi:hypothetical protein
MPIAVDVINRVHQRNVGAATRAQDLTIKAVDSLAALRSRAPQAPIGVTAGVEKVSAPFARILGTPEDFRTYLVHSARDWVALQQRFQAAVLGTNPAVQEPGAAAKAAKGAKAAER